MVAFARGDSVGTLIPISLDPNVSIHESKSLTCNIRPGRRPANQRDAADEPVPPNERNALGQPERQMDGRAHGDGRKRTMGDKRVMATGFFTDTTLCIGCKACEVACKQWNELPSDGFEFTGNSYDNTSRTLGHDLAARRVRRADVGRRRRPARPLADEQRRLQALHERRLPGSVPDRRDHSQRVRLGLHSARRLQRLRVLRRVVSVRRRRPDRKVRSRRARATISRRSSKGGARKIKTALQDNGGVAGKCTLCYDRQKVGFVPACAKACPTESIQFGDVDVLRERARKRVETLSGAASQRATLRRRRHRRRRRAAQRVLLAHRSPRNVQPSRAARCLPSTRQPAGVRCGSRRSARLAFAGWMIFRNA